MTTQHAGLSVTLDRDAILDEAVKLVAFWRPILDEGAAVGITSQRKQDNTSDEVRDEHGRRVLQSAAALPAAVEILSVSTGRAVQLIFPVEVDGAPGWGVQYAPEATR